MDDLYLNAGDDYDTTYSPPPPKDQVEEEIKDKAIKAASYPIMADVAEWFEEQIDLCDNIDNIQIAVTTFNGVSYKRDISVEAQVLAYQLLKEKLTEKFTEFQEFKRED